MYIEHFAGACGIPRGTAAPSRLPYLGILLAAAMPIHIPLLFCLASPVPRELAPLEFDASLERDYDCINDDR